MAQKKSSGKPAADKKPAGKGSAKRTQPNFKLINVAALSKAMPQAHNNLYPRLTTVMRGGIYVATADLLRDLERTLEAEHRLMMAYIRNAKNQIAAQSVGS